MDDKPSNDIKEFFPIKTVADVKKLFSHEILKSQPNLTVLSVVVGFVEYTIVNNKKKIPKTERKKEAYKDDILENLKLPILEYKLVEALYVKFHTMVHGFININNYRNLKFANRKLVKSVSDLIWLSLSRAILNDKAHLQSLYNYLSGSSLDGFGVAFAVVAACQLLGFDDVHLALSEDHVWVVYGENSAETAEVTWHAKGSEDKRGEPISRGLESQCWLYLNGHAVKGSRHLDVAAIVSSMNANVSANYDSMEIIFLQKNLLWLLYDQGHLATYPMAIGNLGELEQAFPTPGRSECNVLFNAAIMSAKTYYNNMHVYPYTCLGAYYFRKNMYKEAFETWAEVTKVLTNYNYTRADEEIYKEVMDIANELIPIIMKDVTSGHSAISILKDPECFAVLLEFYDGICLWEEGSPTPVLHIGWVKSLVNTISKFDAGVRGRIIIVTDEKELAPPTPPLIDLANGDQDDSSNGLSNGCDSLTDIFSAEELNPAIEALTAACGEHILNKEFLTQGGCDPFMGLQMDEDDLTPALEESIGDILLANATHHPRVLLKSEKMRGLKDLLLAEKLNSQAISLQLTAQSQVRVRRRMSPPQDNHPHGTNGRSGSSHGTNGRSASSQDTNGRSKRSRREN